MITDLTSARELRELEPEWWALWEASGATPFQSPAWMIAWWTHLGEGELHVITVRDGGELVAVVPLFAPARRGGRALSMIGASSTDYHDLLASARFADAARRELASWLGHQTWWERLEVAALRDDAHLLRVAGDSELDATIAADELCPVLALPDRVDAFWEGLSRRFRKNLRRARRTLEASASCELRAARADEIETVVDSFFRLHALRWNTKGLPGMVADDADRAFLRQATSQLHCRNGLRLYALWCDGAVIGVLHALRDRRNLYCYLTGFDPSFAAFSPGSLVFGGAIEDAIASGCREVHFLRGGEAYKYRWGAVDRRTRHLTLWNRAASDSHSRVSGGSGSASSSVRSQP